MANTEKVWEHIKTRDQQKKCQTRFVKRNMQLSDIPTQKTKAKSINNSQNPQKNKEGDILQVYPSLR